jgi:hypothetical protein
MHTGYNPVLQGPTEGTSIASLCKKKFNNYDPRYNNTQYNNYNNNNQNNNQNNNHNNNYNHNNHNNANTNEDVSYIVNNIKKKIKKEYEYKNDGYGNGNIDDNSNDDTNNYDDDNYENDDDYNDDNDNDDNDDNDNDNDDNDYHNKKYKKKYNIKNKKNIFKYYIKELILLLCIYIIMSQNFIIKLIGSRISYILPDLSGDVSIIGKMIYGFILCFSFFIFRYFFI